MLRDGDVAVNPSTGEACGRDGAGLNSGASCRWADCNADWSVTGEPYAFRR